MKYKYENTIIVLIYDEKHDKGMEYHKMDVF